MFTRSVALAFAALLAGSPPVTAGEDSRPAGARDFDFLLGKRWTVKNTLLRERLAGSTETLTFDATLDQGRHLALGLGNIDRFLAERRGEPFEGNSLRLFDPKTGEWTIYWIDSVNPTPKFQVRGRFEDGVGTFHGSETHEGREVEMRFLWKDITDASARWEQAYFDENTGEWETNWIMEFELAGPDDGVARAH